MIYVSRVKYCPWPPLTTCFRYVCPWWEQSLWGWSRPGLTDWMNELSGWILKHCIICDYTSWLWPSSEPCHVFPPQIWQKAPNRHPLSQESCFTVSLWVLLTIILHGSKCRRRVLSAWSSSYLCNHQTNKYAHFPHTSCVVFLLNASNFLT